MCGRTVKLKFINDHIDILIYEKVTDNIKWQLLPQTKIFRQMPFNFDLYQMQSFFNRIVFAINRALKNEIR